MATEGMMESDAIICPGEFLVEELAARSMSQRQLARNMGRPQQAISELARGKKALTAETAVQLERVLGIPAYLWLRMEARYRLALARQRLQESA